MWTLAQAVSQAGGLLHGEDRGFRAVGTDSRVDCAGQLFVALRGEHFDGHDHVAAAQQAGAVAAMVDHPVPLDLPQWVVPDTRLGLGHLARAWRARLPGRVVAITGSNGKTTAKEMVAAILARVGRVSATEGNLNNDIGMPLTLLRARDQDFLVLELGANHLGEIGYLADIARPDVALITNAGRAHLEGFGSLEGVARGKGEIASGLPTHGVFVVGGDSEYTPLWRALSDGRRVSTFALDAPADVYAESGGIQVDWGEEGFRTRFVAHRADDRLELSLRLAGHHNVRNALAAATVAQALGVGDDAIRAGLADLVPVKGRLDPRTCEHGGGTLHLIDDTYNANPDSLAAAIEVLAGLSGRRWLVIGDLGELGEDARSLHEEVGVRARAAGIDRLASVGALSAAASRAFGEGAVHFDEQGSLIDFLRQSLQTGDRVLIKGSRLARMERVVEAVGAAGGD